MPTPKKDDIRSCFTEEELRHAYDNLTIFSDAVSNLFFRDKETTQHVLRMILDRDDLNVTEVKTQERIDNVIGHSVRFDVLATDSQGSYYNIEIQNVSHEDLLMRADFYGAAMKMRFFEKSASYSKVPKVYVIFFVKDGRFCNNRLINRVVFKDEDNRDLEFGTRIFLVNGKLQDETPVGKLMHDFSCSSHEEMKDQVIADRFQCVMEGGLLKMDDFTRLVFRRGRQYGEELGERNGEERGEKRGEKRGEVKAKLNVARNLLSMKMRDTDVAKATGLPLEQVQSLVVSS